MFKGIHVLMSLPIILLLAPQSSHAQKPEAILKLCLRDGKNTVRRLKSDIETGIRSYQNFEKLCITGPKAEKIKNLDWYQDVLKIYEEAKGIAGPVINQAERDEADRQEALKKVLTVSDEQKAEKAMASALRTCYLTIESPRPEKTGSVDLSMPSKARQISNTLESFREFVEKAKQLNPGIMKGTLDFDMSPASPKKGTARKAVVATAVAKCESELTLRIGIWSQRERAAKKSYKKFLAEEKKFLKKSLKAAKGDRLTLLKKYGLPEYYDGKMLTSPYWTYGLISSARTCTYTYYFNKNKISRMEARPAHCQSTHR